MLNHTSRRRWIQAAPLLFPAAPSLAAPAGSPGAEFPSQPPEMVREMVSVSHGNVKRVKELVEMHPSLAKASWDWGFGDWETALGAASHVGNREIAEYLLSQGAPATIFSATMLGQLEVVKAFVAAQPGITVVDGPHSIPLIAHARAGGPKAAPVFEYLQSVGDSPRKADTLKPEELNELTGTYTFGPEASDRIEISVARGQLQFTRKGKDTRGLIHLGQHEFHPMGASAVRVAFTKDGSAIVLTVRDPGVVLTARRSL
jgi:hypothetical protein